MQDDHIENVSLKELMARAYAELKDAAKAEEKAWKSLSEEKQKALGRVRFHQLMGIALNEDSDQLEITIDGERFAVEDLPPDILERKGLDMIARGQGQIRRGEAYLAEARRHRQG